MKKQWKGMGWLFIIQVCLECVSKMWPLVFLFKEEITNIRNFLNEKLNMNILYHIEHFYLLNMGLLTLSRPISVNFHGSFHSIGTDPMVVLSFSATSLAGEAP